MTSTVMEGQASLNSKAMARDITNACSYILYCPGVMGVPITFLDSYAPEQFSILGVTLGNTCDYPLTKIYTKAIQHNRDKTTQGGNKVNTRAAITIAFPPSDAVYYTADNHAGYLLSIYPRILIRRS